ncbi:MAG: hypothetical protein ISR59_11720 [Anaerolineales bacterium]|uniref:Uncharacterized protein n=1 Tax=Candidatus Desulfolinea nitratireducens TaxID=2841698 RepID=A0A8J6NJW4_9CHLR|nr:hypothetical protein [Candidatus Desulfolinea nitratireducens]MBL6961768.1 hypothetical protein [Anaerolineales bacterium]
MILILSLINRIKEFTKTIFNRFKFTITPQKNDVPKIDEEIINNKVALLKSLGDRIHSDVLFCKNFLQSDRPVIEKKWVEGFRSACNYSLMLIKSFITSVNEYRNLSIEQFSYYVGKIAVQHLLEVVNVFEQILNEFLVENEDIKELVQSRINKKIAIIEENWNSESKGKGKKLRANLINQYKNKIYEMSFIRDTLRSKNIIDDTDFQLWSFAWDIRNSMHRNFTAIKDINFDYPDIRTGKIYHFNFKKGEELYHPQDLISHYIITEQLLFIMLKILTSFRYEEE